MSEHQLPDCCTPDAPRTTDWKRVGAFALAILGTYLILDRTGLARFSPQVGAAVGLGSVLVIGLASTLSSCGALVTALVAASAKPLSFHLQFHAGRILTFATLGAALGWIGGSLSLSPAMSGALVLVVAALMLAYGLKMLGLVPGRLLSFKTPAFVAKLSSDPLLLGGATFFLPCGFTQSMQLYAATAGSPTQGALVMALFALGSAPPLIAVGMAASSGKKRSKHFSTAAGILIATLGIFNAQNGLALLGIAPVAASSSSSPSISSSSLANGEQLIQMEVTRYGTYEPDVLTVRAGVPVRWEVERGNEVGCGGTLLFKEGGIRAQLKPGENVFSFTPQRPGRYPFTCSMGMFRGTMVVEPNT
ncbi:hypothetical protein EPO34_01425 [Patescibacteria group bacterium]|nr:MAG: hypothetical protein EPO34_01425 [Patescibacteria group bacterium]